ncbi:MAG: menaquinone biosynthetic enzyme MqnA/MqnD family protein [Phycisphaerae bacterium]
MHARTIRLGVVSFLNARPLVEGLAADPRVALRFDVPAQLPEMLRAGAVDAALVPIIDVLRGGGRLAVVSDAGIACDGETMTVRVFSQVPPDRVRTLWVDRDSHTSVALATVLWRELYNRRLELRSFDPRRDDFAALAEREAVLLIGDKVVDPRRGSFAYEVDLGGAWRQHTALPFVFAVWAVRAPAAPPTVAAPHASACSATAPANNPTPLADLLSAARDRGVTRAAQIARQEGPAHGWPAALAERYLVRCLKYTLDERAQAGIDEFARRCAALGLLDQPQEAAPVAALR